MKVSDGAVFCCLDCRSELAVTIFAGGTFADTVEEGVLTCPACKTIYLISEGIPFLLERGYYADFDIEGFIRKWNAQFDFEEYHFFQQATSPAKMTQLVFFNADAEYDDTVAGCPFWRAADANILGEWMQEMPQSGIILDLGCGTGRSAIPLAQDGRHVIGTDISLGMLRNAVKKAEAAGVGDITFFLADAENLPLRPNLFSAVLSYGLLHHVDEPATILRTARKLLIDRGTFYALENHASTVRFLFDWLMKMHKLWDEEAGRHPVFTRKDLEHLAKVIGLDAEVKTCIFLPPHLMNLTGYAFARKALQATDWLFSRVPILRDFGGQVVMKARKV